MIMKNKKHIADIRLFNYINLPIISISHLTELFAELILWYDKPYCRNIEGANEVVREYLNKIIVADDETDFK